MISPRILIADDHDIVREGLRLLIQQKAGWTVCGEASTGRAAVEMVAREKPDIIVMDIGMPELNGLDATRQIRRVMPKIEVLIFTANEDEAIVRDVFRAGARGYLLKSEANQHLIPAIEALCKHQTYFSSQVSELVFAGYLKGEAAPLDPILTLRERETVQLIAEGKSNKEVSSSLGIAVKTVEAHRATIMRKLELRSAADLVRYAIRNGIAMA